MIRFGRCQCCEALKSERDFLRSLIRPKPEPKVDALPVVTFEADGVLSGVDHQHEISTNVEDERQREIDSERARILAGTY